MKFEMIEKTADREVTTRTNDVAVLLGHMASSFASPMGRKDLSGARGEIEIGFTGGSQILLRVLP